jgi:phospholipase C
MNFGFDRSGVRVPTIAISAWVPGQAVVTSQHRATSVIATLRNRWQLGAPLTARDAIAADLAPVLSLETARDPAGWPDVFPRPVPPYIAEVPAPEAALVGLGRAALHACIALAERRGKIGPTVTTDETISRADGIELVIDLAGDAFTGLRSG